MTAIKPASVPAATGYSSDISLYATRYKQGGRTTYDLVLTLEQVIDLIDRPNPDQLTPGNRAIRPKHAADFGKYLQANEAWVSPGMILRAPGIFEFETITDVGGMQFGLISFPVKKALDIRILDGQHRILGVHLAQQSIKDEIDKARDALANARRVDPKSRAVTDAQKRIKDLEKRWERLTSESISVQIMVEEDPDAYRQAFFDIADNALGITASVKSMFDNRKIVNRSLELVFEHPLLVGRVDLQRDRLARNATELMTAKHVAEIVRAVNVGIDGRVSKKQEAVWDKSWVAGNALEFLDLLVECFPPFKQIIDGHLTPEGLRKTSLLGSVLIDRILGGVYYELARTDRAWSREDVTAFFKKLAPHMSAPVYEDSIWMKHTSVFDDGAFAPHSRRQDIAGLVDQLVGWALEKPEWLDAPPAPRPEEVESTEEEKRVVDEILAGERKPAAKLAANK